LRQINRQLPLRMNWSGMGRLSMSMWGIWIVMHRILPRLLPRLERQGLHDFGSFRIFCIPVAILRWIFRAYYQSREENFQRWTFIFAGPLVNHRGCWKFCWHG